MQLAVDQEELSVRQPRKRVNGRDLHPLANSDA
jgi:hypothetical protein